MPTNNSWNSQNPAQISKGGTGKSSFDAFSVVCSGTSSGYPMQNVVGNGQSGQILTSQGPNALPIWDNGSVNPITSSFIYVTGGCGYTGGGVPVTWLLQSYGFYIIDPGHNFNDTIKRYIIPSDGIYYFSYQAGWGGVTGSSLIAHHNCTSYLLKNNIVVPNSNYYINIGNTCMGAGPNDYIGANANVALIISCLKGDEICGGSTCYDGAVDVSSGFALLGFKL